MTPPLYIALRFLTHRKRALLLSLSGVVFGVAIFICTQAQTQGFARYFIDSTIGSNGAVVIKSRFRPRYEPLMVSSKSSNGKGPRRLYFEGITDANEIMRVSRQFSNVVSCSPVMRGQSAPGLDLRMRRSIFTGSIPLSMRKRPIFFINWSRESSMISEIIRVQSSSVPG